MRQAVMLIGSPNVGKSIIFNQLTGMYVTVSNYPGTTVDVSRGKLVLDGFAYEVIDTPGIYSLIPLTDEERVTRELVCDGSPKLLVHVIDAKHIRRMAQLTLALLDTDLPVIVVLNMIDEAEQLGMSIDATKLSETLGVAVVKTAAVDGRGLGQLRQAIRQCRSSRSRRIVFDGRLEPAITAIGRCIEAPAAYGMPPHLIALLLLQGDPSVWLRVEREARFKEILHLVEQTKRQTGQNLMAAVTEQRQAMIDRIVGPCVSSRPAGRRYFSNAADKLTRQPLTGVPILCLVLYGGLYWFVGRLGAGVLVEYFDQVIFNGYLLPVFTDWVKTYIPVEPLETLLAGEFGIVSLGLRYAVAIILPIVSTFFMAFALLEDSGYLPRLAMLLNEVCRLFGLNGRGVIPLSLGLGCGTMAVMVTRTLESKRERVLATFLLALAVPCSAQLGVMLALLSGNLMALLLWAGIVTSAFFVAGMLANCLLPGRQSLFYMELPPIRLPRPGNVIVKAYSRVLWYMQEIIPVFIAVSVILWLGDRLGYLQLLIKQIQPLLIGIGLPAELAPVFLMGFFRRDYGAAGLYHAAAAGLLTAKQLLIAAVALTLFLPCMAQLAVMIKERGLLTSLLLLVLITLIAFAVAGLVDLMVDPAWL